MDPVVYLLAAAGCAFIAWQNRRRAVAYRRELRSTLEESAEIALHLARHEAEARGEEIAPRHLLYALLQDEEVIAAVRAAGGDPGALEDRVLAAEDDFLELEKGLGWATAIARGAERRVRCAHLWVAVMRTCPAIATVMEKSGVDPAGILFRLVHGPDAGEADSVAGAGEVTVVLVNDDISTQEFVVEILREVFGMDQAAAVQHMLQVHQGGQATIGRLGAADAAAKARVAMQRARSRGYPLWVRLGQP